MPELFRFFGPAQGWRRLSFQRVALTHILAVCMMTRLGDFGCLRQCLVPFDRNHQPWGEDAWVCRVGGPVCSCWPNVGDLASLVFFLVCLELMSRTIPLQTFVLQHIAFLQTTHYSFRHLLFWQAPLCHQSRGCTSASALDAGVAAGFWLLRVPRAGASIHDCRIDVAGGVSWLRICWNVLTKFEDLCVLAVFLVWLPPVCPSGSWQMQTLRGWRKSLLAQSQRLTWIHLTRNCLRRLEARICKRNKCSLCG